MKHPIRLLALLLCVSLLLPLFSSAAGAKGNQPPWETNGGKFHVVSMGDSYAAGEGNPPYYGQDAMIVEKSEDPAYLGHQSEDNWAGQLEVDGLPGKLRDYRGTQWHFVASSGATTENIKQTGSVVDPKTGRREGEQTKEIKQWGYQDTYQINGQLDVFYKNSNLDREAVKYVTLSIGGNDVDFEGIIQQAATTFKGDKSELYDAVDSKLAHFFDKGSTYYKLRDTYERISKAAPNATIIVTGYPELIDPNSFNMYFNREEAEIINNGVRVFNTYIEGIVNQCKRRGIKIEFVDVADAFRGHGAYSSDPYLHGIILGAEKEELNQFADASSASMHPNRKGMAAYARCVQKKINQVEGKAPEQELSEKQNIVLVLDTSGSMDGAPIQQTRSASQNFIDTVLDKGASVGVVTYSNSASMRSDFSRDADTLKSAVSQIYASGRTNTEAGLRTAADMLNWVDSGKKIIILMSDGLANEGLTGADLMYYIEGLKAQGIYFYTLGFFEDLSGDDLNQGQNSMEEIASPGCHYEIEGADALVPFFNDVADQITGQDYAYFRIECPVDVEVSWKGEVLSSTSGVTRTSFGTMTFEAGNGDGYGTDNRTKIVRLREDGRDYKITIRGNGTGTMHFTAGFMDKNGEYTDLREIRDVPITPSTVISANSKRSEATILRVDTDGDGRVDTTYRDGEAQKTSSSFPWWIVAVAGGVLAAAAAVLLLLRQRKKHAAQPAAPVNRPAPTQNGNFGAPAQPGASAPRPAPPAAPAAPQQTEGIAFCRNCGAKLKPNAVFCPYCGTRR